MLESIGRAVVEALGPERSKDNRIRGSDEEVAAAERRFKEPSIAGQDVADVREQILGLRRAQRDGEPLQRDGRLGDGRSRALIRPEARKSSASPLAFRPTLA